jgi:hypothetical protein
VDSPVDGQRSHCSRIAERGRAAPVDASRPVLPVDPAVLERIGAVDAVKLLAGRTA